MSQSPGELGIATEPTNAQIPTVPTASPESAGAQPSEEPDFEMATIEMMQGDEVNQDLDQMDDMFDNTGAEAQSPSAEIQAFRWIDSGSSSSETNEEDNPGLVLLQFDIDRHAPSNVEYDLVSSSDLDASEQQEEGQIEEEENIAIPPPPIPTPHPNPQIAQLIESLKSPYCHSTSAEDMDEMQNLQDYLNGVKDNLSHREEDNLIAFALRSAPGMTAKQYERWRAAFSHRMELDSTYKSNSLARRLSNVSTHETSCCVNSCMAFTGEFDELEICLHCDEPRQTPQGVSRNFSYHYSIVDRLQSMFQDPEQSRSLNRDNMHPNPNPDILADKFDGDYFKGLCQRTVKVQGIDTNHRYFTDGREQSISVSLDGFTFYETLGKHQTKTKYNTWLVIAILDNLDPLTRTRCKNIMVLAVIPGPGSPKDLNSYLHWFQRELHILSLGVLTWDAALHEWFLLRAYLLWLFGDMPAIAHIMNMKGHNGMCPCRACYILGSRNITGGKTNYYPALWQPDGQHNYIDIPTLLTQNSRTHESFLADLEEIDEKERTGTKAAWKRSRQESGINGWSILHQIDSIDFPRSFPHDLMHLPALNTIPNFVKIWTGTFPGLADAGGAVDYLISSEDWKEVGRRTEDANRLIPYAFSRAIPNVAQERPSMNAEAWFFWWLQIGPYALDGILKEPYYSHAMDLVRFIRKCMQFEITRTEVKGPLTDMCYKWVKDYETLYYQGREDRVASCPSTIHTWLHVPQDIINAGPSWLSWAFPMEREVQWAKAGVKDAKKQPFAHMAGRALRREQIKHLGHRLGISRQLDVDQRLKDSKDGSLGPKREVQEMGYKDFVLCSPRIKSFIIREDDRQLISHHLASVYQQNEALQNEAVFKELIPRRAEKWMKVRIAGGGDMAHASDQPFPGGGHRDASFIRYHMIVDNQMQVLYGQLQYILKFPMPAIEAHPACTHILAFIRPCTVTNGIDATVQKVYYSGMGRIGIADLTCYVATVGRVPMEGQRYGILDRSTEEAWPTVYEDEGPGPGNEAVTYL